LPCWTDKFASEAYHVNEEIIAECGDNDGFLERIETIHGGPASHVDSPTENDVAHAMSETNHESFAAFLIMRCTLSTDLGSMPVSATGEELAVMRE
jgi:hypothetical protein